MRIKIEKIKSNPKQPRKFFTGIKELSESIKSKGLLEPIMVRPVEGKFEIIHGERRWRACKMAGLAEIESIIRDISEDEAYELSLIENIQRENLTPTEEARAFKQLQEKGYKQNAIAQMIGKGQSYVSQKIRLLGVPEHIMIFLDRGEMTENHVRQIMKLKGIYPPNLAIKMNDPDVTVVPDNMDADNFSITIHQLKPEEDVPFFKITDVSVFKESLTKFAEYVLKHNNLIPQWTVAALWWASFSLALKLTVADLTLAIDRWKERYHSAVVWWSWFGKEGLESIKNKRLSSEGRRYHLERWWSYYADLKHSGSLEVPVFYKDSPWYLNILARGAKNPVMVEPSSFNKTMWD